MKNHFLWLGVSVFLFVSSSNAASILGSRKVYLERGWYNIDVPLNGGWTSALRLGLVCNVTMKSISVMASEGVWENLSQKGTSLYETGSGSAYHVVKARLNVRSKYKQNCEVNLYDNTQPQEAVEIGEVPFVDLKPKHMASVGPCLGKLMQAELQKKEMPVMKVQAVNFPSSTSNENLYIKAVVEEGLQLTRNYWIALQASGVGPKWSHYSKTVTIGGVTYKDEGYKTDAMNTVGYVIAADGSQAPLARFNAGKCLIFTRHSY